MQMTQKIVHLKTSDTLRRIIKELGRMVNDFTITKLKIEPITLAQLSK